MMAVEAEGRRRRQRASHLDEYGNPIGGLSVLCMYNSRRTCRPERPKVAASLRFNPQPPSAPLAARHGSLSLSALSDFLCSLPLSLSLGVPRNRFFFMLARANRRSTRTRRGCCCVFFACGDSASLRCIMQAHAQHTRLFAARYPTRICFPTVTGEDLRRADAILAKRA